MQALRSAKGLLSRNRAEQQRATAPKEARQAQHHDEAQISKRDILRGLLKRHGAKRAQKAGDDGDRGRPGAAGSNNDSAENVQAKSTQFSSSTSPPPSAETSTLTRSPSAVAADSNKNLPSSPPHGTVDATEGQQTHPVIKLEPTMTSLSNAEVEKLFSGAPQFFARSQGLNTGAPQPSVAFLWDDELAIRDLTDHIQIDDDAWGCVTAVPRIILRDPLSAVTSPSFKKRAHFNVKCHERPNMLSMQGLEKGTMGYQAALELGVADALQEEQYGFDSLGTKNHVVVEQRQRLITSKDGLRHLDDAAIMEQLMKCGTRYQAEAYERRPTPQELYNELFLHILHPPSRTLDRHDPYSLAVQIYALVRVLAASNSWIDFSHVEWRIRLGQILWGLPPDDELDDGSSINESGDAQDRSEERYWLLLQLLLACELLIRLDAITEGDEYGGAQNLRASEIYKFEKEANISVKWSLILARTWLENIDISRTEAPPSGASTPKGWLTSLTSKMSLKNSHILKHDHHSYGAPLVDTNPVHHARSDYVYAIKGRFNERQVNGLEHFARALRWPEIDSYVTNLSMNAPGIARATPLNTPMSAATSDSHRTSYFQGGDRSPSAVQRKPSKRRRVEAALHPAGWLSKSYISGLILPGEALSHFLMSTLLENDPGAIEKLGPMANLCGGFVYNGKSFWSTSCVVGRVLAAGRGSAECMGWVSSDIMPEELDDGWVGINADDVHEDAISTGKRARIWGKTFIERESDVLGDADPSNVLPADFILPHENTYLTTPPSNIRVDFKSLDLDGSAASVHSDPTAKTGSTSWSESSSAAEIPTYSASLTFTMTHDGVEQEQDLKFALSKDINFVTAHPCVPSSHVQFLRSPLSPTIQHIGLDRNEWKNGSGSSPAHIAGHPLHKYYSYTAMHLTELLNSKGNKLEELLSGDAPTNRPRPASISSKPGPHVLVIDCVTGFAPPRSEEMESLSRMSSQSSSFEPEATVPKLQNPKPHNRTPEKGHARAASQGDKLGRADLHGANSKMRLGTHKRHFGSDLEILARAVCAERGWNAVISRRRRGCLACSIREAGALGWKVIIRVD